MYFDSVPRQNPSTPPPVQLLVCISDRFYVGDNGVTCEWFTSQNVAQGCDEDVHDTTGWNNTVTGDTPWEACCFCGGGTMGLPDGPIRRKRGLRKPKADEE